MLEVSAGAFRGRLGYSHASYEAGVYRILVDLLSNNLRRMRENVKKANFALSLI
jgi:hypothetical protein